MHDVLLQIDAYADPTPASAIDQAVGFASAVGCTLTGMAIQIDIRVPDNWLAEKLLHISRLAGIEEAKSLDTAQAALRHLEKAATAAGVRHEGVVARADLHGVGPYVATQARTRDLCLVATGDRMDSQRAVAEDVLFRSGRPVLVFHPDRAPLPRGQLKRVTVAWDGSRCSARAAFDAIPMLVRAQDVRILTVVGEKASATSGLALDLKRHFATHDIAASIDEVDGHNRSIGASLDAYCDDYGPDILVMGGFGSSRLKEFVLGGATEHMLGKGRVATFLSH
jgi:nucleotide-binding universal stress UspA family protein